MTTLQIATDIEKQFGNLTVAAWMRQMREEGNTRNMKLLRDEWQAFTFEQKKAIAAFAGVFIEAGEEIRLRQWDTIHSQDKQKIYKALDKGFLDALKVMKNRLDAIAVYHAEEKERMRQAAALAPPPLQSVA